MNQNKESIVPTMIEGLASTHSMCQVRTLPTSSYQLMYQRCKP
jgi:hypothetical protein